MTPKITKKDFDDKEVFARKIVKIHKAAEKDLKEQKTPPSDLLRRVGALIGEKRQLHQLTPTELAMLSGVGYSHIYRIEKAGMNVSIVTLEKLALALNCRVEISLSPLKR